MPCSKRSMNFDLLMGRLPHAGNGWASVGGQVAQPGEHIRDSVILLATKAEISEKLAMQDHVADDFVKTFSCGSHPAHKACH